MRFLGLRSSGWRGTSKWCHSERSEESHLKNQNMRSFTSLLDDKGNKNLSFATGEDSPNFI